MDNQNKPPRADGEPQRGFLSRFFGDGIPRGNTASDGRSDRGSGRDAVPSQPPRPRVEQPKHVGEVPKSQGTPPNMQPGEAAVGGSGETSPPPARETPAAKPGDGTADKPMPPRFQPEPDQPLNPHSFSPRVQFLSGTRTPRVLISPIAYKRMQLYIELARKEVGWLGTITRLPDGDFLIDETFLLEQEVTPTETELSVEGQNALVNELLVKGDEGLEQVNQLRFWGHSHVRMGTSPSNTDERTMERWQTEGLPWAVRGIFNKLGRAEFTIYLYEQGYRICDAPWAVFDPATKRTLLDQRRGYFGGGYGGGGYHGGGYSGGYRPAQEDRSRGGAFGSGTTSGGTSSGYGGWFGGSPSYGPRPFEVPAELKADAALRNEISAEFAAKVSERLLFGFLRGDDEEWATTYPDKDPSPGANEPPGDGPPADLTANRPPQKEPRPFDVRTMKNSPPPATGPKQRSLWDWFCSLFETESPAHTAPPNSGGPKSQAPKQTGERTEAKPESRDAGNLPPSDGSNK